MSSSTATTRPLSLNGNGKQPERPFVILPPNLTQLIDDRFDEEQYDQAVDLLDQLRVEGVRPERFQIQKLLALSLCSLAPGQVASTSRWTLDDQLRQISSRLLSGQNEQRGGSLHSAFKSVDRPSQLAILKATSLLLHYSDSSSVAGSIDESEQSKTIEALTRHVLDCLPSIRRPLSDQKIVKSGAHSDHDESFGSGPINQWVQERLLAVEDVWDLLADGRFSSFADADDKIAQVSEFWMGAQDKRKFHKQIRSAEIAWRGKENSAKQIHDKIMELRRRKAEGRLEENSTDSDSSDENSTTGRKIRSNPTHNRSAGKRTALSSSSPSKTNRTRRNRSSLWDRSDAGHVNFDLTEGAWRTLSILVLLWERCNTTRAGENPLLRQFARARSDGSGLEKTDEIERALDVATSFPRIMAPYKESSNSGIPFDGLDSGATRRTRGDERLISSLDRSELEQRQHFFTQMEERSMAGRAETAAHLLSLLQELVQQGKIRSIALCQGTAERLYRLSAGEAKYLFLPLITRNAFFAARVLLAYLEDNTTISSEVSKSSSTPSATFFSKDEKLSLEAWFADAVPRQPVALETLKQKKDLDKEAVAVLAFVNGEDSDLDEQYDLEGPLTFPTKDSLGPELRTRASTRRDRSQPKKGNGNQKKEERAQRGQTTASTRAEQIKVEAFMLVQQMKERSRINELKFLVAKAIFKLFLDASKEGGSEDGQVLGQAKRVSKILNRLIKAYRRDSDEFGACLSAMKTHFDHDRKESILKDHHHVKENTRDIDDETSDLPSINQLASRCQSIIDDTDKLAHATLILSESIVNMGDNNGP